MAAGLDMAAAHAAANKDDPILMFELLSFTEEGFPSIEHLTLPTLAIVGNPRTGEDETARGLFCARHARVIDAVVVVAEMVAILIFVSVSVELIME